jgi:hypothetical protein
MPFQKAAETFEDLLGIQISKALSERYTEGAGAAYVSLQTAEVERLEREMPPAPVGADKLQVSADGAMVPLVHGQWVEVRTVVIGEIQPKVVERGEEIVHTRNLSYFSRRVSADEFMRLALVEVQRRGLENAKEVGAVMDGADWLQNFVDYHCPEAVRILDFPHAGEHISPIGAFLLGEGTPEMQAWLGKRLHQLKHEGPTALLTEFRNLHIEHPDEKSVAGNLAYLEKRENQLQYPQFRAAGWPIGSGIVESGNKLVVEARLKGAGMHWTDEHVNPMLGLRNILCSDRWKTDWPQIAAKLRLQNLLKQSEQHRRRLEAKATLATSLQAQSAPVVEACMVESRVRPKLTEPPKKSPPNPWRKFKCGKALYQRPGLPKS